MNFLAFINNLKANGVYSYFRDFITKGNIRSVKAKKNILASVIIKGGSIVLNFLIVPISIDYLDKSNYGVWLTISSIIGWVSFFDIGLGNGLRNKLAEAFAKKDLVLAKKYVSTTYTIVSIICLLLFIFFSIINPYIHWDKILNTNSISNYKLQILALIVLGLFLIKMVLQLIITILTADQEPAKGNIFNLISSLLTLIIIYFLTKTTSNSLLYFGFIVSIIPVIILSAGTLFLFSNQYKSIRPSLKYISPNHIKNLTSLGIKFFIIQIIGIIIFSTDNLIITQLYTPSEVAPYYIAYKYFGIIIMLFSIINAPFWSAYTEAFYKRDYNWISNINIKLKKTWRFLTILSIIMLLLSNSVYDIWIGNRVSIPFLLSIFMCVYAVEQTWGSIYVAFINGVGKLKLQLIISIIAGILNIPLSVFFAKYMSLGISGVILATIICLSYGPFIARIQYQKIMNNKAYGIWNV